MQLPAQRSKHLCWSCNAHFDSIADIKKGTRINSKCAQAPRATTARMQSCPRRPWNDFVVYSHLAFAPAIAVGLVRGVYDAVVLTTVMVVLSVWYHREAEANVVVARIELGSTTTLFVYGIVQAAHCPTAALQAFELWCAAVVLGTYAACFWLVHSPKQYNVWHPLGLHVVPALWALAVGLWHQCLWCA